MSMSSIFRYMGLTGPDINSVTGGDNITKDYLDPNTPYKLFRYNKTVYAVKYEDTKPVEHVEMWKSHKHKKEKNKHQLTELKKGTEGVVYSKTQDKAIKKPRYEWKMTTPERSKELNLKLLNQKFLLRSLGIDKYFLMGLYNNKNESNVFYVMPKLIKDKKAEQDSRSFDEFINALRKVNKNGLYHPDYCADITLNHTSLQNEFYTKEGIKLVDLDTGFAEIDVTRPFQRDQWLIAYNHNYNEPDDDQKEWLNQLSQWYEENPGKALSDNPEVILSFFQKKIILLPENIVKELESELRMKAAVEAEYKKALEESLDQYRSEGVREQDVTHINNAIRHCNAIIKIQPDFLPALKLIGDLCFDRAKYYSSVMKTPEKAVMYLDDAQYYYDKVIQQLNLLPNDDPRKEQLLSENQQKLQEVRQKLGELNQGSPSVTYHTSDVAQTTPQTGSPKLPQEEYKEPKSKEELSPSNQTPTTQQRRRSSSST